MDNNKIDTITNWKQYQIYLKKMKLEVYGIVNKKIIILV